MTRATERLPQFPPRASGLTAEAVEVLVGLLVDAKRRRTVLVVWTVGKKHAAGDSTPGGGFEIV